jgi:DNA-binding NarL/FixJ family response regulator
MKVQTTTVRRLDQLSGRELQVLRLVVQGYTSRDIAEIICVKPSTVDKYRSRIMAKLEIANVAGLVRFAIRHEIVEP